VWNGAQAVEAVKTGEYDLVVMDMQMPVMNGVDSPRAIRRLAGPVGNIPIVSLTAKRDERRRRSLLRCRDERPSRQTNRLRIAAASVIRLGGKRLAAVI
jgi:CheY-like chemotaxis protein